MTMMGGTQTDPLADATTSGKKGKKKGKKKKLSAAEKKLVGTKTLLSTIGKGLFKSYERTVTFGHL